MVLVIGGAYQGKLDHVLKNYPGKSVFQCDTESPDMDLTADVINSLHLLVLAQMRAGLDPLTYMQENLPGLKGKTIICDDISSGVVPVDPEMRSWRETVGRCLIMLSGHADEVIRVFYGIGSRIK